MNLVFIINDNFFFNSISLQVACVYFTKLVNFTGKSWVQKKINKKVGMGLF